MSQLAIDLLLGALLALSVLSVGFAFGMRFGRWIAPSGAGTAEPQALAPSSDAGTAEFQQLLSQWHDVRPRLAELAAGVRELKQPPKEALATWRSDLVQVTSELRRALKDRLRGIDVIPRSRGGASGVNKLVAEEPAQGKQLLTNEQIVR